MAVGNNRFAALAEDFELRENKDHVDNESDMYFEALDDATEVEKNKIKVLNYMHHVLTTNSARNVPAFASTPNIEVYHVEEFQGLTMNVCVVIKKNNTMVAAVLTGDDLKGEGAIVEKQGWEGKDTNIFLPRYNWVVSVLKKLAHDYENDGSELHPDVPDPEPRPGFEVPSANTQNGAADNDAAFSAHPNLQGDPNEEIKFSFDIFSGAAGKVIGPKGSILNEIKSETGIQQVNIAKNPEGGDKPRARDPKAVELVGTRAACRLGFVKIDKINSDWKNAPRPPRDGGYGGGNYGSSNSYGGGSGDYGRSNESEAAPVPTIEASGSWNDGGGTDGNAEVTNTGGGGDGW